MRLVTSVSKDISVLYSSYLSPDKKKSNNAELRHRQHGIGRGNVPTLQIEDRIPLTISTESDKRFTQHKRCC